jgi:hypothetical protein
MRRLDLRHRASAVLLASELLAAACGQPSDEGTRDGNEGRRPLVGASPVVQGGAPTDAGATEDARPARTTLSVLFIGNSYTYVNDVPGLLSRIASTAQDGPLIVTDEVVEGGQTLQGHYSGGVAPAKIAEARWTHVVLQQQSLAAAGGTLGLGSGAKELGDLIVAAGARPVWFVTWARAAGDSEYGSAFVDPDHMQDFITRANDEEARRRPGSLLSCVGEAFRASIRANPGIALHQSDLSHATLAGSYLAASTFYVALTGRPVPDVAEVPAGLAADDAVALRRAALVGSSCANLTLKGSIDILEGNMGNDMGSFGEFPFDFGTAGTPISATFLLQNRGELPVLTGFLVDGSFEWTGGVFPGTSDPVASTPPCTNTLAPVSTCQVSVTYKGGSADGGALTLTPTQAYQDTIKLPLQGASGFTDRAHLTISSMTGLCASTNPWSCGEFSRYIEWMYPDGPVVTLVLDNRGGAATTRITGLPLASPYTWNGGEFPGGSGVGLSTSTYPRDRNPPRPLPYCSQVLAPGERCLVAVRYSEVPDAGPLTGDIGVEYADTAGPSPDKASLHILTFPSSPGDAGADAD